MNVAKCVFLSILAVVTSVTVCYAINHGYTCKASSTPYGDFEIKKSP